MSYRTSPADLEGMPRGVPHIIGNEAAARRSENPALSNTPE
jgi:hypothetical protein